MPLPSIWTPLRPRIAVPKNAPALHGLTIITAMFSTKPTPLPMANAVLFRNGAAASPQMAVIRRVDRPAVSWSATPAKKAATLVSRRWMLGGRADMMVETAVWMPLAMSDAAWAMPSIRLSKKASASATNLSQPVRPFVV
jgi:hypothetical protein